LGVLSQDEAREFEQHLAGGCAVCAAEVEAFTPVVAELGHMATPQTPRPELRARVLERVAAEGLSAARPVLNKEGARFVRTANLNWRAGITSAVEIKTLSVDKQRSIVTYLVRLAPQASLPPHRHVEVEESYLLEGDLLVDGVQMQIGDYCRAEPGSIHRGVTSKSGCVFITVCSLRDELLT
jgi:anti-sigma factor ChrR (cupin superfamily)